MERTKQNLPFIIEGRGAAHPASGCVLHMLGDSRRWRWRAEGRNACGLRRWWVSQSERQSSVQFDKGKSHRSQLTCPFPSYHDKCALYGFIERPHVCLFSWAGLLPSALCRHLNNKINHSKYENKKQMGRFSPKPGGSGTICLVKLINKPALFWSYFSLMRGISRMAN